MAQMGYWFSLNLPCPQVRARKFLFQVGAVSVAETDAQPDIAISEDTNSVEPLPFPKPIMNDGMR
jgi:hypothetical protein